MAPQIFMFGSRTKFSNYDRAVRASGGVPVFSLSLTDAAACGGLLLPGGGDADSALYGEENRGSHPPDAARDAAELSLIELFVKRKKPILGICRGMQMVNIFLGGTLTQDIPGHSQIAQADRLHGVQAVEGSLPFRLYGAAFTVNSAHHQAVNRPGAGLQIVCSSSDGVPEAIEHDTLPILGVQWHPERLTGKLFLPECADGTKIFDSFLAAADTAQNGAAGLRLR